jgi:hypothetical protein
MHNTKIDYNKSIKTPFESFKVLSTFMLYTIIITTLALLISPLLHSTQVQRDVISTVITITRIIPK